MRFLHQRFSGCGRAVLAMLAGISLDEAHQLLPGRGGVSVAQIRRSLCPYGLRLGRRRYCLDRMPGRGERAILYLVSLRRDASHVAVLDGRRVLDSARLRPSRLGDSYGRFLARQGWVPWCWWPVVRTGRAR